MTSFPFRLHRAVPICLALLLLAAPQLRAQESDFVGSQACVACHQNIAAEWSGSHHALAWTPPSPETIIGDFDDARFAHDGMIAEFRSEDGAFSITVTEEDGRTTTYPVHSVAGIAPLQQYLLETEPGRLQSFDVVWDAEQGRWYHLYPDQDLPPGDGLHWTGPYKTWNARCAECHATDYQRNFNARSDSYASTQSEIGVGCEACHGPGSAHLGWAETGALTQAAPDLDAYGFPARLGQGDTEDWIQQCAGCHSRREPLQDGNPAPGTPYHDAHTLALLTPGLYHADGQILDEVYVYGSFLQSKMYARGVGCMNCHDPHSATLKAEGNAVCTQCHSPAGNPDFPTLTKKLYDDPEHHFHEAGSDGAQCKSCHMIERVYMGIDGRRDHSFRVPRPDLAAQTGAPDACTDCHADQGPDWAAARIAEWYPQADHRGPHYGTVLAQGRADPGAAAGDLQALAADPGQPAIVRATALYLLQPMSGPELAETVAPLLADPDPLVRGGAAALQRGAPAETRLSRLMPALADPTMAVRIAAAKQVFDIAPDQMTPSQRALVQEALADWRQSLGTRLDFPETHLVTGGMALTMRNIPAATAAFRQVVALDPQRVEAWSMLVRLAEATEGPEAARRVLREALALVPDDPGLAEMRRQLGI